MCGSWGNGPLTCEHLAHGYQAVAGGEPEQPPDVWATLITRLRPVLSGNEGGQ